MSTFTFDTCFDKCCWYLFDLAVKAGRAVKVCLNPNSSAPRQPVHKNFSKEINKVSIIKIIIIIISTVW